MALISPFLPPGTINGDPQPVLTVGTFILRPWTIADSPVVLAAYQDPEITLWHRRRIAGLDDAQALIERWLVQWEQESGASWAVCDGQGLVIGRAALSRINLFEGDGEISYWTLPKARGQGPPLRPWLRCAGGPSTAWGWNGTTTSGRGFSGGGRRGAAQPFNCR